MELPDLVTHRFSFDYVASTFSGELLDTDEDRQLIANAVAVMMHGHGGYSRLDSHLFVRDSHLFVLHVASITEPVLDEDRDKEDESSGFDQWRGSAKLVVIWPVLMAARETAEKATNRVAGVVNYLEAFGEQVESERIERLTLHNVEA